MKNISLILVLSLLGACSYKKSDLKNQKIQGHDQLYSEIEAPAPVQLVKTKKRIVIISTNDWMGKFLSQKKVVHDDYNRSDLNYSIGGISYFSNYLKTIREMYQGQTLLLDSGNFLPVGDFDPKVIDQASQIFTALNYDALTLGLQDFNRTPGAGEAPETALRNIIKKFKAPVLLSNLYNVNTGRIVEWQGTLPYLMKEVNGVKIGIIGLIPDDFVSLTPLQVRKGLYIEGMLQATLRQSRLLRSLGAEIIVVMTHAGITCGEELAQELRVPLSKVNFEPAKSELCSKQGLIADFLQRLPKGIVDVLLTGRNQVKTANIINNTIVMSSFGNGTSFGMTELIYDKQKKEISIDESKVHQPILLCQDFFKETTDCYTEDPYIDHKTRTPAIFWGKPVISDPEIEKKFPLTTAIHTLEIDDLKKLGDVIYFTNFSGETPVRLKISGEKLFQSLNQAAVSQKLSQWINITLKERTFFINGKKLEMNETYDLVTSLENMSNHLYLKKLVPSPDLKLISANEIFNDEITTLQSAPTP